MCQICEVAASEVGAGAGLRLAASAAATTPMPEGVGAQGRKA